MSQRTIEQFERLIRRDPARRGLIAGDEEFGPLCAGHLAEAATHLAERAVHVGLVTGFFVPHGEPPAAETDGPPGTIVLARALNAIGVEVTVLTDEHCHSAVTATADAMQLEADSLAVYPHDSPEWIEEFFTTGRGRNLSHLISLERPGPGHTPESFSAQPRGGDGPPSESLSGETRSPLERFLALVPPEARNRCHNVRGQVIDEHTADIHQLFEQVGRYRPEAKTIGIGDGGNEIGMGAVLWEELHRRLEGEHAARIPCRIAADWNIIAGTSNWGGYALAAAVLLLRDAVDVLRDWTAEQQLAVLRHLVEHGPAVDGMTARREPTVDSLPFLTYIQPWQGMRRLLGFDD